MRRYQGFTDRIGVYRRRSAGTLEMHESTANKIHRLPDCRNRGYRSRRSPGEQLQVLTDILACQVRLREQMGAPDEWLAELVKYANRGCVPQ